MCTTEKHIGFYQRLGQSIIYRLNDALDGLSCHLLAARPGDTSDYIKFAFFCNNIADTCQYCASPRDPAAAQVAHVEGDAIVDGVLAARVLQQLCTKQRYTWQYCDTWPYCDTWQLVSKHRYFLCGL